MTSSEEPGAPSASSSSRVAPVKDVSDLARCGNLAKSSNHAPQMCAHGSLGCVGVAGADGIDDGDMLGQRHRHTSGVHRQLELMADELPAQPLQDLVCGSLGAYLTNTSVQQLILTRVSKDVACCGGFGNSSTKIGEFGNVGVGDIASGPGGTQSFDDHANLGDLDCLIERHRPNPRAPIGYTFDQALSAELLQSSANSAPAGMELHAQISFDHSLVRCEVTAENRPSNLIGHHSVIGDQFLRSLFRHRFRTTFNIVTKIVVQIVAHSMR